MSNSLEDRHRDTEAQRYALSDAVIAAAIDVHRELGPGLLESVYEAALCHELSLREIPYACQVSRPVHYKGIPLPQTYRADLIVDQQLVVEIKAVESLTPLHTAQVLTYLKLFGLSAGLLINFNHAQLKQGLKRVAL